MYMHGIICIYIYTHSWRIIKSLLFCPWSHSTKFDQHERWPVCEGSVHCGSRDCPQFNHRGRSSGWIWTRTLQTSCWRRNLMVSESFWAWMSFHVSICCWEKERDNNNKKKALILKDVEIFWKIVERCWKMLKVCFVPDQHGQVGVFLRMFGQFQAPSIAPALVFEKF